MSISGLFVINFLMVLSIGAAFAISKSIQKFGIQPTNFYDDSFDVFVKEFDKPDGPASQLGMDLQEFLIKIIQQPE